MNKAAHNQSATPRPLLRKSAVTLAALALCLFASCSDDKDEPEIPLIQNLLELDGSQDGYQTFLLYAPDSSEPQTLTSVSPLQMPADSYQGETFMVSYTPAGTRTDGTMGIRIDGMARITNSPIRQSSPEELRGWDTDPVWLTSIWRAGEKINMRLMLTHDSRPRQFALAVDETTLSDPYPTAYLMHMRQDGTPDFYRQYYASFQCSALWATEGVQGVRIRVNNANNPQNNEFTVLNPRLSDR